MTPTTEHPFKYSFTTCFKERVIADLLKPGVGGKVLEMGCGSAYFSTVLKSEFPNAGFEYTGIDLAGEAVEAAKRFTEGSGKIVEGDVTAMPFADGEFQDILYLDVI